MLIIITIFFIPIKIIYLVLIPFVFVKTFFYTLVEKMHVGTECGTLPAYFGLPTKSTTRFGVFVSPCSYVTVCPPPFFVPFITYYYLLLSFFFQPALLPALFCLPGSVPISLIYLFSASILSGLKTMPFLFGFVVFLPPISDTRRCGRVPLLYHVQVYFEGTMSAHYLG